MKKKTYWTWSPYYQKFMQNKNKPTSPPRPAPVRLSIPSIRPSPPKRASPPKRISPQKSRNSPRSPQFVCYPISGTNPLEFRTRRKRQKKKNT